MALYYDLNVFKDVYKLILMVFEVTMDFPREYKYTVGESIKKQIVEFLTLIFRANSGLDKNAVRLKT